MSVFDEFKRGLDAAVGKTEEGRGHLRTAIERQEEAASALIEVAQTSQDPEMQAALAQQSVIGDDLRRVFVMLGQVIAAIGAYQASIGGGAPTPPSSAPDATPSRTAPTQPNALTNSHGDQYPPEAAGLIESLPPRVEPGAKQRTKGRAKVGDKTIPLSSGEDPYWVKLIRDRLDQIDVQTEQLEHHVEIKLAAMMAEWKVPHAEVAINYTPCGYERQKRFQDVCHKVLPKFLPPGYSVTVYGTTRDNTPFQWNYRGQEQG